MNRSQSSPDAGNVIASTSPSHARWLPASRDRSEKRFWYEPLLESGGVPDSVIRAAIQPRTGALLVTLAVAPLLLVHLGTYALWDDEANTAIFASNVWKTGDTTAFDGTNIIAFRGGLEQMVGCQCRAGLAPMNGTAGSPTNLCPLQSTHPAG